MLHLQLMGGYSIAFAVLSFLVSGMAHSPARRAVAISLIVLMVVQGIVNLLALLGGVVPGATGRLTVAITIVWLLAFGYFTFIRTEAA